MKLSLKTRVLAALFFGLLCHQVFDGPSTPGASTCAATLALD